MLEHRYPKARERAPDGGGPAPAGYPKHEAFFPTVPAGTAFSEVARFTGRPDRIRIRGGAIDTDVQLVERGRSASTTIRVAINEILELAPGQERVLARDPAGAGGQALEILGLWSK